MSTELQIEANRANAQLSTGPRSETGKAQASQNSRKHGLSAAHLVIVESDRETFDSMQAALFSQLSPQGELEVTLFDTLLHATWNIRRCRIFEASLVEGDIDPMLLEQNEAKLRQLDRHTRRHDSNFNRALKQLEALQPEREVRRVVTPPPTQPVDADAVAVSRPSPLVNTQILRRAHFRERANLAGALDRHRPSSPPIALAG